MIYLSEIVNRKKARLIERNFDINSLKEAVKSLPQRPSFYNALSKEGLSIIGEIKKASPSKGLIKEDFQPIELAKEYEQCVDAISVLTEEHYFLGSDDYLEVVSREVSLPTLCKDFIVDPVQIYRAKILGASCILLIVNILTDTELSEFIALAKSLEMDSLVETHTEEEVQRALKVGATIIGINNRNLSTFVTSIEVTKELAQLIPDTCLIVSESGILSPEDVTQLNDVKLDAILVGENFMRSDSIIDCAKDLRRAYVTSI
jgi:indole-3-glycerol phosphate synthase